MMTIFEMFWALGVKPSAKDEKNIDNKQDECNIIRISIDELRSKKIDRILNRGKK